MTRILWTFGLSLLALGLALGWLARGVVDLPSVGGPSVGKPCCPFVGATRGDVR